MRTHRLLVLVTTLALASVGLAACGNGDGDAPEGAQETTTTVDDAATADPPELDEAVNDKGTALLEGDGVAIEADDFFFKPTFVQTEAGASFTVEVTNVGKVAHTFTIEDTDVDEAVDPGDKVEVQVDVASDTPVVFICRFHASQGMRGAFYTG